MTDIVEMLRERAARKWTDEANRSASLFGEAADEIEHLRAERDAGNRAAAWCDKHNPNGGARGLCVICSGMALSAALAKISYLCDGKNEMECGPYDIHCDENAVVEQVKALITEHAALRAEIKNARSRSAALLSDLRAALEFHSARVAHDTAMASSPG